MIGPGEISLGLNIFDRLRKLWAWGKAKKEARSELVAEKFLRLFESHGVHRNQIPRFFGHELTLQDVQSEATLLAKLDETMLDDACSQFAVRREWLDGADTQIFPIHRFYKQPRAFVEFLGALKAANPDSQLSGVVLAPIKSTADAEALLILEETIGRVGDKPIYRYHFCDEWMLRYWKSRAYLTACVAIAWRQNVFIHGGYADEELVRKLAGGLALPTWSNDGIWSFGVKRWDPEDMALRPEAFLAGLDSELENFGLKAGLSLWLSLCDDGFMKTGLDMYSEAPRVPWRPVGLSQAAMAA